MACRFATCPTRRSPVFVIATIDGVSRDPSLFSRTVGSPPSIIAMTELVVPRSIPITCAIASSLLLASIVLLHYCVNSQGGQKSSREMRTARLPPQRQPPPPLRQGEECARPAHTL